MSLLPPQGAGSFLVAGGANRVPISAARGWSFLVAGVPMVSLHTAQWVGVSGVAVGLIVSLHMPREDGVFWLQAGQIVSLYPLARAGVFWLQVCRWCPYIRRGGRG